MNPFFVMCMEATLWQIMAHMRPVAYNIRDRSRSVMQTVNLVSLLPMVVLIFAEGGLMRLAEPCLTSACAWSNLHDLGLCPDAASGLTPLP